MTAHLYWRINVSANAGDASFLAIAEVEMRATAGDSDQCIGGNASASSSDPAALASSAFDNDATTRWSTASGTRTGWLRYQFPTPVDVAQYTIQAHPTTPARSPSAWALEYSDDGTSWTEVESRVGINTWTGGEVKSFTVSTTSKARVSQVAAEIIRTNTTAKAVSTQIAIEVLRPNPGVLGIMSQAVIEVLRPNADVVVASSARPQVFVCT